MSKRLVVLVGIVAVSVIHGTAVAQIWSQDFSEQPTLNQDDNANITNEWNQGEWVHTSAQLADIDPGLTTNFALRVRSGTSNGDAARGAAIALHATNFPSAGSYALELVVPTNGTGNVAVGVAVSAASIGSGGTVNGYRIRTEKFRNRSLNVLAVGDGTASELEFAKFRRGTTNTVSFPYSGSGDVVLSFGAMTQEAVLTDIFVDSLSISAAAANSAPYFTTNGFPSSGFLTVIGDPGTEGVLYTGHVTNHVEVLDDDLDTLTFSKTFDGVSWLEVAADGSLSGTPANGDDGTSLTEIQVSDGNGGYDFYELEITVADAINDAPEFVSDPFLPDGASEIVFDVYYADSISGVVSDKQGDPITFAIDSGPSWLAIDSVTGVITGTPTVVDIGLNEWNVSASDNQGATNTAVLQITVSEPITAIFTENFATEPASVQNFAAGTSYGALTWNEEVATSTNSANMFIRANNTQVEMTDGYAQLEFNGSAKGRVLATALDESLFGGVAGVYTVNYDFIAEGVAGNALGLKIFSATADSLYDLNDGVNDLLTQAPMVIEPDPTYAVAHTLVGTGAYSNLAAQTVNAVGNGQSLDFVYDGSSEIVLMFYAITDADIGSAAANGLVQLDNIKVTIPPAAYDEWALGFGLAGIAAASTNDVEPDGVNNLLEYAFNGNPTNASIKGTFPTTGATFIEGGTNWIEYVHVERIGDDNLSYTLEQKSVLPFGEWANSTDAVFVGEGAINSDYKSVTNKVPTDGKSTEFLRTKVILLED